MALFKKICIVLGVFVLIFTTVLYILTTPYGENIIRGILENELRKVFGQQVSISLFETNLLSRVQVNGFAITRISGTETHPFVSIEYAQVTYRLWHLITKKPTVDSVTIDKLFVSVVRDSSGFQLPYSRKEKKQGNVRKPLDFGLKFGLLDLRNSSFAYNDRTIPVHASAGDVDVYIREKNDSAYGFKLEAGSWEIVYHDYPVTVDSLTMSGYLTQDEIGIEHLDLSLPDLRCSLKTTVRMSGSPFLINGDMSIQGNIIPIAGIFHDKIPSWLNPQRGIMNTHIRFTGTPGNPDITLSMDVHDLQFKDTLINNVTLMGVYSEHTLRLQKMQLGMLDGIISGEGEINADSLLSHDFSLTLNGINLQYVWELFYKDSSPYRGRLNGMLQTRGPLKIPRDLNASAHLSLEKVIYESKQLSDFETDISYKNGLFNIEFKQSTTELSAGIKITNEVIQGDFQFHTSTLEGIAGFAKLFDLYGSLDAKGTLSGNIKKPSINVNFNGQNIRFHGFPLDTLHGRVIYENGNVLFQECVFSGNLVSVDSLSHSYRVSGLSGGVNYNGNLKGMISNPDCGIELHFSQPTYKNFQFDSIDTKLRVVDRKVEIENAQIKKDSLEISLEGDYSIPSSSGSAALMFSKLTLDNSQPENKYEMDIKKTGALALVRRFLGAMNLTAAFADSGSIILDARGHALNIGQIAHMYSDSLNADGLLDFELQFKGSLEQPFGSMNFALTSPQFKRVSMDSVKSSLRIEPDKITVESVEIYLNNQKTWAQADIELKRSPKGYPAVTGQSQMRCLAEGKNVIVQLLQLIMPPEMTLTGSSNYRLECDGMVKNPHIRGNFNIVDANLRIKPDSPPIQHLNISATLQDSILIIDTAGGTIIDMPFVLKGQVATSNWERFRMAMNGRIFDTDVIEISGTVSADSLDYVVHISNFNVAILQPLISDLQNLKGRVNAAFTIKGAVKDPALNGTLNVSDISFRPPLMNVPFTSGFAALRFDRDNIFLDSLSVGINEGKLLASGSASYNKSELSHLDVNAIIHNVSFERPKEYTMTIDSAHLSYKKHDNYYDLEGEVVLGESRLVKDFQPKAILPFIQKVDRPAQAPSPVAQQVRINVLIRADQTLWVDNNLARMRVRSDIEMIGTLAHPNVTGRMSVEEGYIVYLDKKFKIDHGIVDFIDPNRFNPIIDFQAGTNLKSYQTLSKIQYDITLTVNGPLEQATFELTSDPSLNKTDIIALLTVGATREQLTGRSTNGTDTSLSDILKERAEVLSSQKISGYFSRKVGNVLGLEEISVEGNLFTIGKSSGPQLVASEKISDRMGITYSTAVGHLNEQSVRLDYRLNKYFSLEGQTDQKGRSAIDLKYRLRFK